MHIFTYITIRLVLKDCHGAEAEACETVNATDCGFVSRSRKLNILYFHCSVWFRRKARHQTVNSVSPFNTKCLPNAVKMDSGVS